MQDRHTERDITQEEFESISTDKKMRNAVAYAHASCNEHGKEKYKIALYKCDRLIVNGEQIFKANTILKAQAKETQERYKNSLLFIGMGMTYKTDTEIGNYRIRTEFLTPNGERVFVEFEHNTNNSGVRCKHSILRNSINPRDDKNNYKDLERHNDGLKRLEYAPADILKLVNETYQCNFKEVHIDSYDLSCDGILCISPPDFKMARTQHNDWQTYVKANREAGYNFKNMYTAISQEDYWYMLEVLPPARMYKSAFLMCEHNTGLLVNGAVMFGDSLKESPEDRYYVFTISSADWDEAVKWIYKNLKNVSN